MRTNRQSSVVLTAAPFVALLWAWLAGSAAVGMCVAQVGAQIGFAAPVMRQESATVTVADSPVAWQLFQQALDQARDNPAEAARLCQRLLDGFADRVVPSDDPAADRFESVLERVERFLRERPTSLERYRLLEGPEAARLLKGATLDAELENVARTRGLTTAGLQAHLRLAEREFHAAKFDRVLARLERLEGHPDLTDGADSSAYWFLRGASAALLRRTTGRDEALARLASMTANEAHDAADALARIALVEPASVPSIMTVLGVGEAPDELNLPSGPATDEASGMGWQPIWSVALPGTAFARTFLNVGTGGLGMGGSAIGLGANLRVVQGNQNPFLADLESRVIPRQFERARYDGSMLATTPIAVGDIVIVSDGTTVIALDRLSHRVIWSTTIGVADVDRGGFGGEELACVAAGEGAVIAYSGAVVTNDRNGLASVVCLDLNTGAIRWQTPIELLPATPRVPGGPLGADPFDGLSPSGEPAIGGGTAYVLARKLTPQLETVEYLLAFDLTSGALRWSTYVCSSGGMPRISARPASRPVLADGAVWIATSVGAVASVDATDGHVRWIQRFLVPMREMRYPSEPWEMSGPALVGDALFAISPDQTEVVQFEKSTGRRVRSFPTGPSSAWGTPRYLLADDGANERAPRIFAVGADVHAIDPDAATRSLWTLSKANEALFATREGVVNRSGIRGRVQLAGGLLVVPGLRDVLLVSRDSGLVKERVEAEGPANPLLVWPQLFLGQNAALVALMPTASAERVMRQRIADLPSDPEGALALLDLGLRTKRMDLCTEAARAARDALARAGEGSGSNAATTQSARGELVERLLRILKLDEAGAAAQVGPESGAILGEVASTSSQRVRHILAEAAWLERRGRPEDAMRSLARVLSEPSLAAVTVEDGAWTLRPARALAAERLASIARSSPAAFSARNAAARERLVAAGDNIEQLRAVLLEGSGTVAARDAALRLAGVLEKSGRPAAALAVLQRALRASADGEQSAGALLNATLELAGAQGWTQYATDFADLIVGRFPATVTESGGSLAERAQSRDWLVALGSTPGEAIEIPGRVVRMVANAEASKQIDGVLMAIEHDLVLLDKTSLKPRWTAGIEDRDPVVLLVGGEIGDGMLLWEEVTAGEHVASVFSLTDGSIVRSTPSLSTVLPPEAALAAGRPVLQMMPDGEHFDPSEMMPFIVGRKLVIVRRNGDAVGFDLGDISKPAWTAKGLLGQVYGASVSDLVVALGGRGEGQDDDAPPVVVSLDPATGELLSRNQLDVSDDVRWLRVVPTGELLVGSGRGIVALDALAAFDAPTDATDIIEAPELWRSEAAAARDTVGASRVGTWIVAYDRSDVLTAMSIRDGQIADERFQLPSRSQGNGSGLHGIGRLRDGAVVQFDDRLVAFDRDGALLGDDAIFDEGTYLFFLPIEDGFIAVRGAGGRQVPYPLSGGMRTEFPYLVYRLSMRDGCRVMGPALQVRLSGQRCERIGATDGVLFFSTQTQTIAVPLPVEPRGPAVTPN